MIIKRIITGFFLSILFLLFFIYLISCLKLVLEKENFDKEIVLGSLSESINNFEQNKNEQNVVSLDLNAEAAISVKSNLEGDKTIIFQKNSDLKVSIASLTKLMTAVVVYNSYDLSKNIIISAEAESQFPIKRDVKMGDILPVENLLEIMLIESSNRAAYALAEVIGIENFVELMNNEAKKIGMENTIFIDPTGINSGNISTANDLVKLVEYILENYPKLAQISRTRYFYTPGFGGIINTNELLNEIPEIVLGKTGFTDEAKGCLIIAIINQKDNNYFINIVLGAEDRFTEMKKILNSIL